MLKIFTTPATRTNEWKTLENFAPGDVLESQNNPGSFYLLLSGSMTDIPGNSVVCLGNVGGRGFGHVYGNCVSSLFRKVKSATLNIEVFPA